jgi:hypothetical protein
VRVRLLLAALAALPALVHAAPADAARWAVGLAPDARPEAVAFRITAVTGRAVERELKPLGALVVETPSIARVRALPGVEWVERIDTSRRLAFVPSDPLVSRQWYLPHVRAFDAWSEPPPFAGPIVAVIDSGIDGDHPEFAGRIRAQRSFVPGRATVDQRGHGTFVAGIIAARHNGQGIAGIAFASELVVAKVVNTDGSISVEAEAAAIRWAVDQGARVINLSLGGLRDPLDPRRDTYSELEAAAVEYAVRRGVLVVAAVGNADQAPAQPWPYANWPAALPHVVGVGALARDGSVPLFSNRDRVFTDLAAPGQDIFSTFPRALTAQRPACVNQGYSECAGDEYRRAEGTSFAAPQVAAAAALVLGARPDLRADQVSHLLTRTAADANASTGCRQCALQRDALTGWGSLDLAAAIAQATQGSVPPADDFETNDEAGARAATLWGARGRTLQATIDYWDDPHDVYRIMLRPNERLEARLSGAPGGTRLALWRPGTRQVEGPGADVRRRLAQSSRQGHGERLVYRAPATRVGDGWYYLQVKSSSPGFAQYTLSYTKR